MTDTEDFNTEVKNTDDAFLSASTPKDLNGLVLEPFSSMRQAVALALGMQGNNATFFFDSVIMGYLCTLKRVEVSKLLRDKDAAVIAAFDWADQQGWSIYNFKPVGDLYLKVTSEIAKSTNAYPKDDENAKPVEGNAGELPAPSN